MSFSKFFYASFLKPHTGDGLIGQQAALESFYKVQVRSREFLINQVADIAMERLMSTMPLVEGCFAAEKIC